jgi:hypothetical protein
VAGPDQIPRRTAKGCTSGFRGVFTSRAWHSNGGCAEASKNAWFDGDYRPRPTRIRGDP